MPLPVDPGNGPGALVVHVRDRDGRLLGVRSAVVDPEALRSGSGASPDCGPLSSPPFAGGAAVTEAAESFAHDTYVAWTDARVVDEDLTVTPCVVTLQGGPDQPVVEVEVAGSRGRYGVVAAHGSVATDDPDWGGTVRVTAEDGWITIDDPYWCSECGYRLAGVTYEGIEPAFTEGTDGGSDPRRVSPSPQIPDRPGLVLVTTYAGDRLVEVTAVTVPAGDFATRSFCVADDLCE
jgi:hypothetical protein